MSVYTTEVRWIVEEYAKETQGTIYDKVTAALPKIFDQSFPIWSEDYRQELEKKIVLHYLTKEIAFETVELWKLYLLERLNLIMPYYNQMYRSIAKDYDIFEDVNRTETLERGIERTGNENETLSGNTDTEGTASTDSTNTISQDHADHSNSLNSDFPQSQIGMTDYATTASESNGTQTANDTSTTETTDTNTVKTKTTQSRGNISAGTENETYTRITKGLSGSRTYAELAKGFRESLINIDSLIIEELHDLFMLIY